MKEGRRSGVPHSQEFSIENNHRHSLELAAARQTVDVPPELSSTGV